MVNNIKTDLQKFKDLLDEIGVKYFIYTHEDNITKLGIDFEHLCRNKHTNEIDNTVSIVFDEDNKLMYFEGIRIQ